MLLYMCVFKNVGGSFDSALSSNFGDNFIDHKKDALIRTNELFLQQYLSENKKKELC